MKFEKINYNKIKVTVTLEDLTKWGISFENIEYDTPEAQDLFWTLIRRAEQETGFTADNSQVIVEAMPLKGEGVVLFVTKVEDEFDEFERLFRARARRTRYKVKKDVQERGNLLLFRFDEFDDVCSLAQTIADRNAQSSLYALGSRYFLSIVTENHASAFAEFGSQVRAPQLIESYLREHGDVIIRTNAVKTLTAHF